MKRRLLPAALAIAIPLLAAAAASGETPPAQLPAPAAEAAPAPAPGRMKLELLRVGGNPPFAPAGSKIKVRGTVTPYVAGQQVRVSFYLQGRRVSSQLVAVSPGRGSTGTFTVKLASSVAGLADIRAAHAASAAQAAFTARAPLMRFVHPEVGPGSSGMSVAVLQDELAALHYVVPQNGRFDELTGDALIAYRKVLGMARVPQAGPAVFAALFRGAGSFHVRYPRDGRHVEGDLTRQVLALIEPGGRVRAVLMMSSGKPSTPTVIGHFQVYRKEPGANSEDMVNSNYFISGYAIHGYPEVPTWAASHGCLRIPIPDSPFVYSWVRLGTPVDVYFESGGGSARVRSNAGP